VTDFFLTPNIPDTDENAKLPLNCDDPINQLVFPNSSRIWSGSFIRNDLAIARIEYLLWNITPRFAIVLLSLVVILGSVKLLSK